MCKTVALPLSKTQEGLIPMNKGLIDLSIYFMLYKHKMRSQIYILYSIIRIKKRPLRMRVDILIQPLWRSLTCGIMIIWFSRRSCNRVFFICRQRIQSCRLGGRGWVLDAGMAFSLVLGVLALSVCSSITLLFAGSGDISFNASDKPAKLVSENTPNSPSILSLISFKASRLVLLPLSLSKK